MIAAIVFTVINFAFIVFIQTKSYLFIGMPEDAPKYWFTAAELFLLLEVIVMTFLVGYNNFALGIIHGISVVITLVSIILLRVIISAMNEAEASEEGDD